MHGLRPPLFNIKWKMMTFPTGNIHEYIWNKYTYIITFIIWEVQSTKKREREKKIFLLYCPAISGSDKGHSGSSKTTVVRKWIGHVDPFYFVLEEATPMNPEME